MLKLIFLPIVLPLRAYVQVLDKIELYCEAAADDANAMLAVMESEGIPWTKW